MRKRITTIIMVIASICFWNTDVIAQVEKVNLRNLGKAKTLIQQLETLNGDLTGVTSIESSGSEVQLYSEELLSVFQNEKANVYNEIQGSNTSIDSYIEDLKKQKQKRVYVFNQFHISKKIRRNTDIYVSREIFEKDESVEKDFLKISLHRKIGRKKKFKIK